MKRFMPYLVVIISLALGLCAAEIALRFFLPIPLVTIGHSFPPNARLYGWGYAPHERIFTSDPDTGAIYSDYANSRGWRDREHAAKALPGTARILVLGDSNSFGANVASEQIYPRLLERRLNGAGHKVEVIVMAYGGWSTDHQLEALLNEGLAYQPDIVVLQFTINDLTENALVPHPTVRQPLEKPFYYLLNDQGQLERRLNDYFAAREPEEGLTGRIRQILASSEILKRAYIVYDGWRSESLRKPLDGYPLDSRQIEQAKLAFGLAEDEPLVRYLRQQVGHKLDDRQVEDLIAMSAHAADPEGLRRVLSSAWLNQYWDASLYHPTPPDPAAYSWRLFQALLFKIRANVPAHVPILLLSDHEQGYYNWQRYWFRISASPEARRDFFAVDHQLVGLTAATGIEFVATQQQHVRFRLDPHPNEAGHQAMAANLIAHLMTRHPQLLDR